MAISAFGVTYSDIESALQDYSFSDVSTDVAAIINRAASEWGVALRREGWTPATVEGYGSGDEGYLLSQEFIICRASAEVARRFTHQDPALSAQRDARADQIMRLLHAMPEAFSSNWDRNTQRGSARADGYLQGRSAGQSIDRNKSRNRWSSDASWTKDTKF